jgi:hypothetical protein
MKILRVLEYEGTEEFISSCLKNRAIRNRYEVGNGIIREAILGGTDEVLSQMENEKSIIPLDEKVFFRFLNGERLVKIAKDLDVSLPAIRKRVLRYCGRKGLNYDRIKINSRNLPPR